MSEFAELLDSAGSRERQGDTLASARHRAADASFRARLAEEDARPWEGGALVRQTYAANAFEQTDDAAACEPNRADFSLETLYRAIKAAKGDRQKLRELRRCAARALHPDAGGNGLQLAECNALIDAALESSTGA